MREFHEILRRKLQEVSDFPRETTEPSRESHISADLLNHLFRANLYTSSNPKGEIPATAAIYRQEIGNARKLWEERRKQNEVLRRGKRREEWLQYSPELLQSYTVFADMGEWDIGPGNLSTLKKAYRRLLLRLHPDVSTAVDATEKTRLIVRAYARLTDDAQSL